MAAPVLTPVSTMSKSILPEAGNSAEVTEAALPFGIYVDTDYFEAEEIELFQKGASDQVAYVHKKLGGDVLDIELTSKQVYAAYEEACLEYSYLVNIHQSKNILSNVLGGTTGSFDESGQMRETAAEQPAVNKDTDLNLKYPKFDFAYSRRVSEGIGEEVQVGGSGTVYSASFNITEGVQDYDLQSLIADSNPTLRDGVTPLAIGDNKITINKVYYKSSFANWNFYGFGNTVSVLGNLSSYGQYADDSTFNVVPVWQNKGQAMAYEDALRVRHSHWSYQLRNNYLRIYPTPVNESLYPKKMWVEYTVGQDTWVESPEGDRNIGTGGINNMNTIPFENVPYKNINAIGKQWIRRFALSLSKEMLGLVRSKFASIPIPGNDVSLNGTDLVSAGKEEQIALRDELKEILDELTYGKMMEGDAEMVENSNRVQALVPMPILTG